MRILARALRPCAQFTRRAHTAAAPPGAGPNHRSILALDGNTIRPFVQPNAHVAPSASVIGSVTVNDKTTVRGSAVVRGDLSLIEVGAHVVVGEGAVIGAGVVRDGVSPRDSAATGLPMKAETSIGDYSFVGAGAVLRGCVLEGENFVGDGAVIGEGAVLGRGARVEHRAVVALGVHVPPAEVWAGNPACKVGSLSPVEVAEFRKEVEETYTITRNHMYEFLPVGTAYLEKEALAREAASAEAESAGEVATS